MHKDVLGVIGDMPGNRKAEPKRHGLGTGAKVGIATAVIAGAAYGGGMAYTEKYNGEPVSGHTLKVDAMHPYNLGLPKIEIIPSTFDPAAINSVIGPENSIQMTFADYEKFAPPIWNEQTRTMTVPIPAMFNGNQISILHIQKDKNAYTDDSLSMITIDGLKQGDILISPFDGEMNLEKGEGMFIGFSIRAKDSYGNDIVLWFATNGLNPLIPNIDFPTKEAISIHIKKGDPIGSLLTSDKHRLYDGQIKIKGNGPFLQNLNLAATPEGKAIIIKEK
jgi:hypothetical protein